MLQEVKAKTLKIGDHITNAGIIYAIQPVQEMLRFHIRGTQPITLGQEQLIKIVRGPDHG